MVKNGAYNYITNHNRPVYTSDTFLYEFYSDWVPSPDSVNYVFSEHLFEHLTYAQATNMLKECYRVMKPNGIIRLATPNIEFLLDLYQHPEKDINQRYIEWAANEGNMRK